MFDLRKVAIAFLAVFVAIARPYTFFGNRLAVKQIWRLPRDYRPIGMSTTDMDFSFKMGEEFEGTIVSALPFGIFVDISKGKNVLLPRSVLSKGHYEKLKSMADAKSQETIKIEVKKNRSSFHYSKTNHK